MTCERNYCRDVTGHFIRLVFPAEAAEAAAGAAEAAAQHRQQQDAGCNTQGHPHPHHKLAMHLERVAAVALLDGLDAVAVLDAPASLEWLIPVEHVGERLPDVVGCIPLHQPC